MGTIRLDATNIRTYSGGTTYGDVWNDNSDATSAPVTTAGLDAKGSLPAYTGGEITGMSFHVRASATGAAPIPIMVEVSKPLDPILLWVAGGSSDGHAADVYLQPLDWLIPNDGVIRDYVVSDATEIIRWAGWATLDEMRPNWAAGGLDLYLWPDNRRGVVGDVLIYEAWVEITTPTVAPPCQIYPRDDDQGVGTAAIWPPPSSGRPGSYY